MVSISEVFNFIGRTNLFNFAIFLGIIIWVCKKIDVSGKLEAAKNDYTHENRIRINEGFDKTFSYRQQIPVLHRTGIALLFEHIKLFRWDYRDPIFMAKNGVL